MKFFQTLDVLEEERDEIEENEEVLCNACKKVLDIHNCYVDGINMTAYCSYECYRSVMIEEYF